MVSKPPGDHYRKQTSGEGVDSAFMDGEKRDQGMKGSKQMPQRGSQMGSKGLNQPVKGGTKARRHAPYKGNRV